ncbi:MAG TPA: hypothetical protein VMT57_01760 [Candidatus Thermoplasmatota archaeon]|nr:hypothetical protein [Candidatus Thermoplasmatota archaeon]
MKRPNNIYVALQLDKDQESGELVLSIQFDKTAPNFFTEKGIISWYPTAEELDFVSEAFDTIGKGKHNRQGGTTESQKISPGDWVHSPSGKEAVERVFDKKEQPYVKA